MKKINLFKHLISIFIVGLFIFLAFGSDSKSDSEKKEDAKTEFSSCGELREYLGWSNSGQHTYNGFTDLKEKWEGKKIKISDPFCNSEQCYVNVLFEGVKVNGSDVWLIFEADERGNPFSWCTGFDCDRTGKIPTIQYN
jgi:hypothetical protein